MNKVSNNGIWQKIKSQLHSFFYFIEKSILEPFMAHENQKLRIAGFNSRLSQLDNDGGQVTNNKDLKMIEGHVFENNFQIFIFKIARLTKRWRERLEVVKGVDQGATYRSS